MPSTRPMMQLVLLRCWLVMMPLFLTTTTLALMVHTPRSLSTTDVRSSTNAPLYAVKGQKIEYDPLSYAEQSRLYRRDFYSHELWLKHRAKNRFVGTLSKILESGVVRQLADELLLVGAVATFVCVWNCLLVTGYEDLNLVHHDKLIDFTVPLISLPMAPFTLSSPALSLLLVFKTNTSYQRWDEARKAWGMIVNNCRTVIRESAAWVLQVSDSILSDDDKIELIARIRTTVWLFPRSLQRHLLQPAEDAEPYAAEVRTRLPPALAEDFVTARHKPTRALYEISVAVNDLPLDSIQRSTIDTAVSQLCDASGACERIFGSPVPSIYTRHAARFLELWMFFLPMSLWEPFKTDWNHWFMVPSSMIIGFFLLGIEELAIQLEEPFSVLPLGKITNGIDNVAGDHFDWFEKALAARRSRGGLGKQVEYFTPNSGGYETNQAHTPWNNSHAGPGYNMNGQPNGGSLADSAAAGRPVELDAGTTAERERVNGGIAKKPSWMS